MNDNYNIAPIHGRPVDQPLGHILCREDFWQKGDPMFASTNDHPRSSADRKASVPTNLPQLAAGGNGF